MKVPSHPATPMRQLAAIAVCLALCSLLTDVHAGMRGRGKYSGVVIFDRWDTCFLLSGPYITYISDAVKEALRPHAGQAIQIDVSNLTQPINPGDALAKSYLILGQAPDDPSHPIADKLEIKTRSVFDSKKGPWFDITVRNVSLEKVRVNPSEVGVTLLGINRGVFFGASDGKSVAWITRADLVPRGPDQSVGPSWNSTVDERMVAYAKYNAAQPCAFNILSNFPLMSRQVVVFVSLFQQASISSWPDTAAECMHGNQS
jgi:hypothetical protein